MTDRRPTLAGGRVLLRAGRSEDVDVALAIVRDPAVAAWWGDSYTREEMAGELLAADGEEVALVIEAGGRVAGVIQYHEETTPAFRHAGIDIFLGSAWQGRGLGTEAIGLLVAFLFDGLGHHRITIDPAAANARAIRCYEKVGFRPVGVMRAYQYLGGRWQDGLLMERIRGDPPAPAESS